jgi:transcription termination/antitermination protein NusG
MPADQVVFVSEKPEEQFEQQQIADDASPAESDSQRESPALPSDESSQSEAPKQVPAGQNGSSGDPHAQPTDAPPTGDAEDPSTGDLPAEAAAVEGDAARTDAAPSEAAAEMPESDTSWTVADAPGADAPGAEAGDVEAESAEAEQAEAAPPAPAKKRKKNPSQVEPLEEIPAEELEEPEDLDKDWYILKVQSNREKSIRDALERRVKVAGLERFFGDVIVPTEDVAEYKNGKRRVTKRKLWPGYIVVHMAINDDTWFLVRETPGIGDFTGSIGKPSPMLPHEVERIIPKEEVESDEPQQVKIGIRFKPGDRVRVKDGYFQNFEGDVESIDEANGRVTVICSIFGRSTPVELEHWQIEDI